MKSNKKNFETALRAILAVTQPGPTDLSQAIQRIERIVLLALAGVSTTGPT